MTQMDPDSLLKQPPNTTLSPYEVVKNVAKRPAPSDPSRPEDPQSNKRHQSGPPSGIAE